MTDRVKAFWVVLDKAYRDDDIEELSNAIMQMKGVIAVKNVNQTAEDQLLRQQVKYELSQKLWEILK